MGGHDAGQHQFTGLAKHFNAWTIVGRRNVSLQTNVFVWLGLVDLASSLFRYVWSLKINIMTCHFSLQCVLATYAGLLAIGLFFKLKPKKQAAVTEK